MGTCLSRSSNKNKPSKRISNNQSLIAGAGAGTGGRSSSTRWNRSRSSRKEKFDDAELHQQAVAAAILLKQHQQQNGVGSVNFDRSTSLRYPNNGNNGNYSRKQQGLPRSSSSRARSLTDPLIQPHQLDNQATRHARRVYVGGLPPSANEQGAPVKVTRPSDYNPSLAATLGPSQPNPNLNLGAVGLMPGSAGGLEGPDRIFVGGVPYFFTEVQIREILESIGPLRGFDLVKDRETGNSKGYAFCVYQDLSLTDIACEALNGIKMGDKTLTVRRANQGTTQPKPEQESILLHAQQQKRLMLQPTSVASKVLCLTQVVTEDELKDDEDYEDILADMKTECGKFGDLVNVIIPRPNPIGEPSAGVGKVFLEYVDTESASKARARLHGRKFGGNEVVAVFYAENKFQQRDFED